MSAAMKAVLIVLAFSLLMGLIALLPDTSEYPLPSAFTVALGVVIFYVFAWVKVFWFFSVWWAIILLNFGLEITIWTARQIIRITGWLVRLFA